MHEMSIAESIVQLVEQTAQRESARRVKLVILEIGALSVVEPDSLKFCFDAVTRGSIAQDALLEIVSIPGVGWCMQCQVSVPMVESLGACPNCGSYQVQATGGTEMRVREIEIE